jgi:hypothetical protein
LKEKKLDEKFFKSIGEVKKEMEEAEKQWNATRRVGDVQYDPKDDTIIIYIKGDLSTYDIAFSHISNARGFTEWMFHLNEKTWMTGQLYKDLFDCIDWVIYEKTGQRSIQFYNG